MAMPDDTIALNLARIVHRLMTTPRGWEIEDLKRTLGIADRTYRKYAALLRAFTPFSHRGESQLQVVTEGESRYLRLASTAAVKVTASPELMARMSAHQLTLTLLGFLGETDVAKALRDSYAELRERLGDLGYA